MLDVTRALAALEQMDAEAVGSEEIKRRLGLDRFEMSHLRRLARSLTPATRSVISRAGLSFAHARAIARLKGDAQEEMARDIAQRRWSARRAEQEARARVNGKGGEGTALEEFAALAETIAEQVGHPVAIRMDRNDPRRGDLVISFADLACFDAILDRLGVRLED